MVLLIVLFAVFGLVSQSVLALTLGQDQIDLVEDGNSEDFDKSLSLTQRILYYGVEIGFAFIIVLGLIEVI